MYALEQTPDLATPQAVKLALEVIDKPAALTLHPLSQLPVVSRDTPAELRVLLLDCIFELVDSRDPRAAESGRLLRDYYVKKVGSHEVIMERLHLSHATYYRRLRRGYWLVALQINRLCEFALWFSAVTPSTPQQHTHEEVNHNYEARPSLLDPAHPPAGADPGLDPGPQLGRRLFVPGR